MSLRKQFKLSLNNCSSYLLASVGIGALSGVISVNVSANQEQMLLETDWIADIPKVVFATRQEQEITSAPSSVTIITREMIRAQGALNIAEVLRLVPGFQVFFSNGSTFGVTAHGYSDRDPRRLEVRVNGRSVYLPQLSSVAWESLGVVPDDIDHIEVVRGSNVPAYGSNAILGAINIVTRNSLQEVGGAVTTTFGSVGTKNVNFRQNLNVDSFAVQFRGAYKENNGFKGVDDEAEVGHAVLNTVYTPNLFNSFELEMGYSNGEFGTGDGDHLDEFASDHRKTSWFNANWQNTHDDRLMKWRLSYADYDFKHSLKVPLSSLLGVTPETIPLIPLWPSSHVDEELEISSGARTFSVFNTEGELHLSGDQWRSVWGVGTRINTLKSESDAPEEIDSVTNYLFGNVEWTPSSEVDMNFGFMVEDQEGFDADISPRLAINYHVNNSHHLRASATRAYRQPALLESDRLWTIRFKNGDLIDLVQISDPKITSERVDTFEVGYFFYAMNGRVGLDLKLFREEMRNAIDGVDTFASVCASPAAEVQDLAERYCQDFFVDGQNGAPLDEKVRVFSNAARWDVEGLEAQLSWKLSKQSWLRANYAYLQAEGYRDRQILLVNELTTVDGQSVPQNSGGILYSYEFKSGWQLGAHATYTDFINWRSGTDVDSHTRLDVSARKSWEWSEGEVEVSAVLQNLVKDTYLEFQKNNEFGRRGFVTITLSWY